MCDLCLVTFWDNRAFTAGHQRESARCVSNTRRGIVEAVADPPRECATDKTTPMKLSSLQVQYSRGLQLRLHLTLSPAPLCIFGFSSHKLSLEASLDNPCGSCKTGGSTWRTQHCRTAPQTWSCKSRTAARRVHGQSGCELTAGACGSPSPVRNRKAPSGGSPHPSHAAWEAS